jgi:hypothetical protein
MPVFQGGPLDPSGQGVGQFTPEDEAAAAQLAGQQGGGAPAPEGEDESPGAKFDRALNLIRDALATDGFDDNETLILEKVTTLLQQIKSDRMKTMDAAMQGKVSPQAFRQMGAGGGQGGY